MRKEVTVDVKVLKNEKKNLVSYIQSKINSTIIDRDNELELETSTKNVKEIIKNFLYHNGLSDSYKIISEGGKLKIIEHQKKSKKPAKRTFGTTPFETLPYYYPENPIPKQKKR